jgi:pSer/pThr/pTyr-binding forkhead associated (FHA) protein
MGTRGVSSEKMLMKAIDQASPWPGSSIRDRLKAIDVSSVDRLLAIRDEQRRIEAYRAKAATLKSNVAEAVHARVLEDYDARSAALGHQLAPLQAQARAEYGKVQALIDQVGSARERARLEKEELEFRHAVGELDQAQLAEGLKAPQQVLDLCQSDQSMLDAQISRFVAALGTEERAVEAATVPTERIAANQLPPQTVVAPEPPAVPPPAAAAPPPDPEPLASEPKRPTAIPPAVLLLTDATGPQLEYRLGETNGIGLSNENKIQIVKPGVSRLHAVIAVRAGGFVVEDLSSQNGTFVNGERVGERHLADGDTIEIGTVRFVFRMPWPAGGSRN